MPLRPIHTAQRPPYPPWCSRLVHSLRRATIVAAATLLPIALSCAAPLPGVPIAPSVPTETQSDQPRPEAEEPGEGVEEWVLLPVEIWFEAHCHELDDEDRAVLREAQLALEHRADVRRIRVEGHVFLGREPEPGLALARAQAVIDYMVVGLGMSRDLFEATDGGDGVFYNGFATPDIGQFRRVWLSALVRRAR